MKSPSCTVYVGLAQARPKYNQAVQHKVQSLELAEEYMSNGPTLKQFVQKMAVVALCTPFQWTRVDLVRS